MREKVTLHQELQMKFQKLCSRVLLLGCKVDAIFTFENTIFSTRVISGSIEFKALFTHEHKTGYIAGVILINALERVISSRRKKEI